MSLIGSLVIGASLRTQKLEKNAKRARGSLDRMRMAASGLKAGIVGLGAALGAGVLIAGLKSIVTAELAAIDKTSKFSDEMGLSISQMKGLELGAGLTGTSLQNLEKGLQRLVRRLGEAKNGTGEGIKGLEQLGLAADDLTQVSTFEALQKISEAIKNQKTPAEKAAAAYSLFGRQGLELLTFLRQGEEGLAGFVNEADQLGSAFSRVDGAQVEAANDAILRMTTLWKGVKQQIAIKLAPVLTGIAQSFTDLGKQGFDAGAYIGKGVKFLVKSIGFAADLIQAFRTGFKLLQAGVTAGLGWIIKGWAWTGQAIEKVVNLLPGVEVQFSDTLTAISDDLIKLSKEQFGEYKKIANQSLPSAGIERFFNSVESNVARTAQTAKTGAKQIGDSFNEGMLAATEGSNKLIDKLNQQIATFGMSANAAEIWKLKQAGAADELITKLEKLNADLEKLGDKQKLKDWSDNLKKSLRSNAQIYYDYKKELDKALNAGFINKGTYFKALKKQYDELFKKDKTDAPKPETNSNVGFAGALDFRSAEARSVVLRSRLAGQNPINKVEKNTKAQLAESKKQTALMEKQANNKPQVFKISPS